MIDLHCHILPGFDDGAADLAVSLAMARASVADGVTVLACTPHILPGLYHNTGSSIRQGCAVLQAILDREGIALRLTTGADNHIVPDLVTGLRSGHLLALADSHYVLVEPPDHIAPLRLEELFFDIIISGYTPILTHPERLTWVRSHYDRVQRLVRAGVWMQITSGSLTGAFGRSARYWAERMLDERCVHILATDAHDAHHRPPDLSRGRDYAAKRVGDEEAENLVLHRPGGVIANDPVSKITLPTETLAPETKESSAREWEEFERAADGGCNGRSWGGLRRLFARRTRKHAEC